LGESHQLGAISGRGEYVRLEAPLIEDGRESNAIAFWRPGSSTKERWLNTGSLRGVSEHRVLAAAVRAHENEIEARRVSDCPAEDEELSL
jgi:hypothetical protein